MSPLLMPPVRVPLQIDNRFDGYLPSVGSMYCRLPSWVIRTNGSVAWIDFRVTSGVNLSMVSYRAAREKQLPLPAPGVERRLTVLLTPHRILYGVAVRPGLLTGWWHPGCPGVPVTWHVLFVDAPVEPTLGLGGGSITPCRWAVSDEYATDAPWGALALEPVG